MLILWSHPTWKIFHITTANIIEETFDEKFKNECIDLFTKICNHIPCGMCRAHASEHMKTINKDEIKTARDFELFFHKFHNEVNTQAKKELFLEEDLKMYKKKSVRKIIIEFKNVLRMYYRNEELLNEFNAWYKKNNDKFIHYKKPKKERKETKVKKDTKLKKDTKDRKEKEKIKERKEKEKIRNKIT